MSQDFEIISGQLAIEFVIRIFIFLPFPTLNHHSDSNQILRAADTTSIPSHVRAIQQCCTWDRQDTMYRQLIITT
ncbi:unnamed protein product [Linum tenue]|uniref:Uncharacterized protein n=1 Tax=Linum tenue TaxID=586396 RepID=A0AAV0RJ58_9ROSI|nr:unnamed protein product [Linum tenue]